MFLSLIDTFAAPGGQGTGINWSGIEGLIKSLAGPIIMVLGVIVLFGSKSGNFAKTFGIVGNAIIGCCLLVGGGLFIAFGDTLVNTIFS